DVYPHIPSSTLDFKDSTISGAVLKSISAIHIGIKSFLPNFISNSSNLAEYVFVLSITSSKLYFFISSGTPLYYFQLLLYYKFLQNKIQFYLIYCKKMHFTQ